MEPDGSDAVATGESGGYPPGPPPSRARVLGGLWWRSLVLATAGGTAIGILIGPIWILVTSSDDGETFGDAAMASLVFAAAGAAVGVMLGMSVGALLGGIGALWLVPYRGRATTTTTVRVVATAAVALWFPLLTGRNIYTDVDVGVVTIMAPALAGAWWLSPWVSRWYVNRMSELGPPDSRPSPNASA